MSDVFSIVVCRANPIGNLVPGTISVNGADIGKTYENKSVIVPPGIYKGRIRYLSQHHFVQGVGGAMAKSGDFLLEVDGIPGRKNILFHTGNKPKHSAGCILLGPITSTPQADGTVKYSVGHDSGLAKLRRSFYGTDNPVSCPDLDIQIELRQ